MLWQSLSGIMPPKGPMAIANKNNPNAKGVLPVNAAAMQQSQAPPSKSTIRLKLEVRRLPPALTKDEFLEAIGAEWKPMAGRVDWFEYRSGKIRGTGNVSEQSRAYLHLTNESHIKPFESRFFEITFQDAKGSHKDPNLKHLQPMIEFAPNQRIPAAKQRVDGRQGTIDQDPEFIAFLEAETRPVSKPPALETANAEKTHEKVSSTPLLDDLREKKANKAKASAKPASAKVTKSTRPDTKEDKSSDKSAAKKDADSSPTKPTKSGAKPTQPAKDVVKSTNKHSNKSAATSAPSPAPPASKSHQAPARKRGDRVTPNAIKNMLQRDLGLAPAGRRGAKAAAAAAAATASEPAATTSQPTQPTPTAADNSSAPKAVKPPRNRKANAAEKTTATSPAQENAKSTPPTPAAILKKPPPAQPTTKQAKAKANAQNATAQRAASSSPAQSPAPSKPAKAAPQPSAGATKAYLKHANASQGITEPLILAALSPLGEVVKVDIDKRKGTALAEFKNHDGLKAAMAKRSIPVAQGAIEVLEFRERPAQGSGRATPAATRGGGSVRGKGRSARGSAANTNPSVGVPSAPASPAPTSTAAPQPADAT